MMRPASVRCLRAATVKRPTLPAPMTRRGLAGGGGGPERGVDGAGEGLDGDGGLVGYCVGYAVEL